MVATLAGGATVFFSVGIMGATRVDVAIASAQDLAAAAPAPEPPPPGPPPAVVDLRELAAALLKAQPTPEQWFRPSGRNGGTEGLVDALASLALRDNAPLYRSDTWGRTGGNAASDHHVSQTNSWAGDLAVRGIQRPTPATETAAKRIAAALGEPNWTSGDLSKTIDGYRFQVLWKVAGHFNHVHVGVRKVS